MDKKITDILFNGITTLTEAYTLDEELRITRDAYFYIKADKEGKVPTIAERIKDKVSRKTYEAFKTLEEKNLLATNDPDSLNKFFETAHNIILATPKLQLQVAIDLNDQLLATVKNWVERQMVDRIFIDVVTKPQILAGCVIVYQGAFRDYSLRKQLEENAASVFKPVLERLAQAQAQELAASGNTN